MHLLQIKIKRLNHMEIYLQKFRKIWKQNLIKMNKLGFGIIYKGLQCMMIIKIFIQSVSHSWSSLK